MSLCNKNTALQKHMLLLNFVKPFSKHAASFLIRFLARVSASVE